MRSRAASVSTCSRSGRCPLARRWAAWRASRGALPSPHPSRRAPGLPATSSTPRRAACQATPTTAPPASQASASATTLDAGPLGPPSAPVSAAVGASPGSANGSRDNEASNSSSPARAAAALPGRLPAPGRRRRAHPAKATARFLGHRPQPLQKAMSWSRPPVLRPGGGSTGACRQGFRRRCEPTAHLRPDAVLAAHPHQRREGRRVGGRHGREPRRAPHCRAGSARRRRPRVGRPHRSVREPSRPPPCCRPAVAQGTKCRAPGGRLPPLSRLEQRPRTRRTSDGCHFRRCARRAAPRHLQIVRRSVSPQWRIVAVARSPRYLWQSSSARESLLPPEVIGGTGYAEALLGEGESLARLARSRWFEARRLRRNA